MHAIIESYKNRYMHKESLVIEILQHARSIWMSFIFEQITHITIFINNLFCTIEYLLMKNCDMCYLSEDKTYPNA